MNKLNFPSDRGFTAFEVEALSRRKKKRSVSMETVFLLVFIILGVLTIIALLPEPTAEAHMEPVIVAPSNFCEQAARDLLTWDREASPELKDYCPNI